MLPSTDDLLRRNGMSGVAHPNRSEAEEGVLTCSPLRNSNKMKSLAEALQEGPGARIKEPEDSVSGTNQINQRKFNLTRDAKFPAFFLLASSSSPTRST